MISYILNMYLKTYPSNLENNNNKKTVSLSMLSHSDKKMLKQIKRVKRYLKNQW